MYKRKIISIILIMLMLTALTTEVFASEYRTLKFCSKGQDVVKLQNELQKRGYYHYKVDGIYGKITERAVINFQIDNKLRIDGFAGKQTQSKLYGKTSTPSRASSQSEGYSSKGYSSNDIYWLARVIHAEAGGEPYKGKVAVGNVVLNRVKSKDYPNTIYNVIFEYYKNIPQFSPVADGTIFNTPSAESTQAAKDAVNGVRPVGNSTCFFNPSKAAGNWIVQTKSYITRIGNHVFYQ